MVPDLHTCGSADPGGDDLEAAKRRQDESAAVAGRNKKTAHIVYSSPISEAADSAEKTCVVPLPESQGRRSGIRKMPPVCAGGRTADKSREAFLTTGATTDGGVTRGYKSIKA